MRDEGRREEKEKEKKEPVSCLLSPHYNPYIIIHASTLLSVYIHTQQHRTYCVQMCNTHTHTHTHTRNGAEKRSRGRSGTERNGGRTEEEWNTCLLKHLPKRPRLAVHSVLGHCVELRQCPDDGQEHLCWKEREGDEETRGRGDEGMRG